jgi:hypothetical protein
VQLGFQDLPVDLVQSVQPVHQGYKDYLVQSVQPAFLVLLVLPV